MQFTFFHLMPYRPLDMTERHKHSAAWVVLPNTLYDPKKGAEEYLLKPISFSALELILKRIFIKRTLIRENRKLHTQNETLLRNIGIEDLIVTGFLTDQCIDHTVKDAADRGYYATCISDACMANTHARHAEALACFAGYCRMLTTDGFLETLNT